VSRITPQQLRRRKRRIEARLRRRRRTAKATPVLEASNIHYEVADRMGAIGVGGVGMIHQLARRRGLIAAIDRGVHVLKTHLPYHESDHVLNVAYNVMAGGTCLEDIELRRRDEHYLNALGTQTLPDPTTAGDFCRRFTNEHRVLELMESFNQARLNVWRQQEPAFFAEAVLDSDGAYAPTFGECKKGMDINYKGEWGFPGASAADLAGEYQRAFIPGQPSGQSAEP